MQSPTSPAPDTISTAEPSERLKAHPYLMRLLSAGALPLADLERRALAAERLSAEYSSDPFHQRRAAADPDYWSVFSGSAPNY